MKKYQSLLHQDWQFASSDNNKVTVTLPHTWNNIDGQDGGNDYYRGTCNYQTTFPSPVFDTKTECVYLEFEGVNSSAEISVNGQSCMKHHGGYSTFRVNITEYLKDENSLMIAVDNSINDSVYPQKADFTFYGGIYRDIKIITVNKKHFDLDYFGGKGIKATPILQDNHAIVKIESWHNAQNAQVTFAILDASGKTVATGQGANTEIKLENPHLWNGLEDPYQYTLVAKLIEDSIELDEVSIKFGVRSFFIDKEKGFFLNGKSYPLKGVSRHQDKKQIGNALSNLDHDTDLSLILEMGVNSLRLAHYQHCQYFYDRCDELGLILWAEIPYISEHLPNGRENTISQMKELIVQNYHHPSIVMWGISNEITISTKDRKDMLDNHHVLEALCHKMDETRLTTLACYAMCSPFHPVAHITDVVGWNLYLGWYVPGLFLNDLWISFFHLIYPNRPLGFSEYGCEGMPNLHSKYPRRGDHTEEYQAKYHEFMLRCFSRHPYMWGNYVWNMFDFAADARDQGGEPGMNHKGLVTFNRETKKDSFYLYKAFWSNDPFVHIAGKRMIDRTGKYTTITIYTNQTNIQLFVNGKLFAEKEVDKVIHVKVPLSDSLTIEVKSNKLYDKGIFNKVEKANPTYKLIKDKKQQKSNWV